MASQDLGVCVLQHCVGLRRRTLGGGLGDRINPNNQKFHDNRGWEIGQGCGDIWEIGRGLGYRRSLNNQQLCNNRGGRLGEDLVIYGILGEDSAIEIVSTISDLTPIRNLSLIEWTNCGLYHMRVFRDNRGWEIGRGFYDRWYIEQGFSDKISLNNQQLKLL